MWTVIKIENYAAAPDFSWCALAMTSQTPHFVKATACSKIRPVGVSGGPSKGGSF